MTASKYIVIPILTCLMILIDWYVWQAVKVVFQQNTEPVQQPIHRLNGIINNGQDYSRKETNSYTSTVDLGI